MNSNKPALGTGFKALLLSTAIAAGAVGMSAGHSGLNFVTPSFAEAVKVEAPAAFSFGDVVEAVSPAVVSVRVEAKLQPANDQLEGEQFRRGREFFERFFGEGQRREFRRGGPGNEGRTARSQGSGFFVSDDGYVVTNHHVIDGGTTFTVVLADGTEHDAKLIGTDERTDLAVLKVEADEEFTYVDFGDSRPRIGDWVVAVGNPFGLGGTVTAGIVSAHGREIGASRYDDFIQIDAAVNKGNSGGPAFNLSGEVIGVNTAIFSPSGGNVGIAFAIPAALADEVVTDLIENGSVTRGWLGVQIQKVTPEIAESVGLDIENGTIVTSAQEGSPAADAGLQSGDIITEVEGKNIKGPKELAKTIAGYEPKSDVELNIWRDGEQQSVTVTLGELQQTADASTPAKPGKAKMGRLGLALQQSPDGLKVVEVKPDSPAAERGFQVGDVIASVNGTDIETRKELRNAMKAARDQGRKSALLQIERNQRTIFVPVPLQRG